jgi:hypothetical protein
MDRERKDDTLPGSLQSLRGEYAETQEIYRAIFFPPVRKRDSTQVDGDVLPTPLDVTLAPSTAQHAATHNYYETENLFT